MSMTVEGTAQVYPTAFINYFLIYFFAYSFFTLVFFYSRHDNLSINNCASFNDLQSHFNLNTPLIRILDEWTAHLDGAAFTCNSECPRTLHNKVP